ncbi:MAG: hypothetical protein ACJAS1_006465, partial [Oleiphilaceae bacterium]
PNTPSPPTPTTFSYRLPQYVIYVSFTVIDVTLYSRKNITFIS